MFQLFTTNSSTIDTEMLTLKNKKEYIKSEMICNQCLMTFKICFAFKNVEKNKYQQCWLINELPAFLYIIFRLKQFHIPLYYYLINNTKYNTFENYLNNKTNISDKLCN